VDAVVAVAGEAKKAEKGVKSLPKRGSLSRAPA